MSNPWAYPVAQAMQRHTGFRFAAPQPRAAAPKTSAATPVVAPSVVPADEETAVPAALTPPAAAA